MARELFIRHALVQGEWRARHKFFETNRQLLDEAAELENRARRRDIVVDEETLFDFYDARIAAEVVSGAHFDTLVEAGAASAPGPADLRPLDAGQRGGRGGDRPGDFPDAWQEGPLTFSLSYHFEPGAEDDGVTIDVPLATLNAVGAGPVHLERARPAPRAGHRPDPLAAQAAARELRARARLRAPLPGGGAAGGGGRCSQALSRQLRALTGVHVPDDAWDLDQGARATCGRPSASSTTPAARWPRARTSRR